MVQGRIKKPETEEEAKSILGGIYDSAYGAAEKLGGRVARLMLKTGFIPTSDSEQIISHSTDTFASGMRTGLKNELRREYQSPYELKARKEKLIEQGVLPTSAKKRKERRKGRMVEIDGKRRYFRHQEIKEALALMEDVKQQRSLAPKK